MLKTYYGKDEIFVLDVDPDLPDQEILFWEES